MVFAVAAVRARVDAKTDVGISPRAGTHGVGGVTNGVSGEEYGSVVRELIGEATAGPDGSTSKDGAENGYEAAEVVGLGFQGRSGGRDVAGYLRGWYVPVALLCVDFGWSLGIVEAAETGRRVDEGLDSRVLPVGIIYGVGNGGEGRWRDDLCVLQAAGWVKLKI